MNLIELEGYKARIDYDPDIDMFRGEIIGLNGTADFYGKSLAVLKREFRKSLKVFLAVCEEKGIAPLKDYSGKFNLRIPPELHREIASRARGEHKSINQWVTETLQESMD